MSIYIALRKPSKHEFIGRAVLSRTLTEQNERRRNGTEPIPYNSFILIDN